jgi:hypothetical protein
MVVDGPGFLKLHVIGTQESNGSIIKCLVLLTNGSIQSSHFIPAVFYGQLIAIVGCLYHTDYCV